MHDTNEGTQRQYVKVNLKGEGIAEDGEIPLRGHDPRRLLETYEGT